MSEEEVITWLEDWYDRWSGPGEPWTMESLAIGLYEAFDITPKAEIRYEYGLLNPDALPGEYGRDDRAHLVSNSREHILQQQRRGHPAIQAVRRRKAGEWEPVTGGDDED